MLLDIFQCIIRLRAEGLTTPLDPVYILFLQKHVLKVNTQRSLRLTSNMDSTMVTNGSQNYGASNSSNNRNKGFTSEYNQAPFHPHLLIMSTPPIKEIHFGVSSASSNIYTSPPSLNVGTFTERPRGMLVAHLHEHRNSVMKICPLTATKGLFASGSRDEVRIWDAGRMEGKNIANRSRCNIKLPGDRPVVSNVSYTPGANIIGVTDDQNLYGFG